MRRLAMLLLMLLATVVCACTVVQSRAAGFYESGRAADGKYDLKGAIAEYTKAIDADPAFVKAYLNRGIDRDNLSDHPGAVADFTKVIELDPTNLQAHMSRGSARIFTKDLDGAVEDFTKAIELDPRKEAQKVNYRNRAAVYDLQNRSDLAAADEKQAAELDKKQ